MTKNQLLINHKRFKNKKNYNSFNVHEKKYYEFFNGYAKKNYSLIDNDCLCGKNDDQLISLVDRVSIEFETVICKNCGLVRAPKYFNKKNVEDFYKDFYRKVMSNENDYFAPDLFFNKQIIGSKKKAKLIKDKSNIKINGLKILDLGGGIGGALEHFKNSNEVFLADYFDPYLEYAKTKGIKVIKGSLREISFKPDIIILSHVIEHWNDFENQIEDLIKIQKINKTLNYIEFPGIDSLKTGRRDGDFLKDIHIPHVYYFSSYVFENLMNRYGFEKIYINSEIKSLFIYTGVRKELKNYYKIVKDDLIKAEYRRKIQNFKKFIKLFLPKIILDLKNKF